VTTASPQLALEFGLDLPVGADFLNRPPRSNHQNRTGANSDVAPGLAAAHGCEPVRTESPVVVGVGGDHPQPEHSRWARATTAVARGELGLRNGSRLLLTDAYETAREAVCLAWRTGALLGLNTADGPIALPAADVLGVCEVWG
jgi:hypothetical protein